MTTSHRNLVMIAGAGFVLALILVLVPPIQQNPQYHAFADNRTVLGIPNFWNVFSNAAFLLATIWGVRAFVSHRATFTEPWERVAYAILLIGTAAVAAGSSYYHLHPDNQALFWDRLPMTVVFMSLVATTIGERISMPAGKWSLAPLILLGATSVLVWRWTGDLRLYGLVQFGSMLLIPVLVITSPPRYSGSERLWFLVIFYGLAKVAELLDHEIGPVIATGGHPWKHLAAACAIFYYIDAVVHRIPVSQATSSLRPQLVLE